MRLHAPGICLAALATIYGGVALAQDALPETPPELRDFRLDGPRPAPQPQPQPDPPAEQIPPPAIRTVPQQAQDQVAPTTRADIPQRARAVDPADQPQPSETAPDLTRDIVSEDSIPTTPSPGAAPLPVEEAVVPTAVASETTSASNLTLILAIIVSAALLALLGLLFWRRRRQRPQVQKTPDVAPPIKSVAPVLTPKPSPKPAEPLPIPMPSEPDTVTIVFIPHKATISFTTLTVQGQLQIVNTGEIMAKDMQLRAILVSASNQQQHAIDTFFADPAQVAPNPLGDARPGERLGLSLELSVSLNEIHAFPLGDQRLMVPIMVAALTYLDERGATQEARLACMIGREANPPQPKMGPLRLDTGPRSFASLGQRPVYA